MLNNYINTIPIDLQKKQVFREEFLNIISTLLINELELAYMTIIIDKIGLENIYKEIRDYKDYMNGDEYESREYKEKRRDRYYDRNIDKNRDRNEKDYYYKDYKDRDRENFRNERRYDERDRYSKDRNEIKERRERDNYINRDNDKKERREYDKDYDRDRDIDRNSRQKRDDSYNRYSSRRRI